MITIELEPIVEDVEIEVEAYVSGGGGGNNVTFIEADDEN